LQVVAKKSRQRKKTRLVKPAKKRLHTGMAVMGVVMLIGIVGSGLGVVKSAADTRAKYQALAELQKMHDGLLEEQSRLSLERSTMSSLQKIEQVAANDLHMHFPKNIMKVLDD